MKTGLLLFYHFNLENFKGRALTTSRKPLSFTLHDHCEQNRKGSIFINERERMVSKWIPTEQYHKLIPTPEY